MKTEIINEGTTLSGKKIALVKVDGKLKWIV